MWFKILSFDLEYTLTIMPSFILSYLTVSAKTWNFSHRMDWEFGSIFQWQVLGEERYVGDIIDYWIEDD